MPEGPEIEVVRLSLRRMTGQQLNRIVMHRDHRKVTFTKHQLSKLRRVPITEVYRVGKLLAIATTQGQIIVGAGMSGKWRWVPATEGIERIKHDIFSLECSNGTAIYNDARRFGSAKIVPPDDESWHSHIGIDGLDPRMMAGPLAPRRIQEVFARKLGQPIKPTLLDQSLIAGIGNIYASEICHRLRVHPARPLEEFVAWKNLGLKTLAVLSAAVKGKGSTIAGANKYETPDGEATNGLQLRVYGRLGQRCFSCGNAIQCFEQAGRTTFYCPVCQAH